MLPEIWIDADSCPTLVRNFVLKTALEKSLKVYFVANKIINSEHKNYQMIVVEKTKDSADNFILNNAKQNDIVITRDIVFASKLVEKSICVINDRGKAFTKDNIKSLLEDREYDLSLSEIGFGIKKGSEYNKKQLAKFVSCFEKELQKILNKSNFN